MPSIRRRCPPGPRLAGGAADAWAAARRACSRVTRREGPTGLVPSAGSGSGAAGLTTAGACVVCLGACLLPLTAGLLPGAGLPRGGGDCPAAASRSTAVSSRPRAAAPRLRSGPWCLLGGGCTSKSARHMGQVNLLPPTLLCCCSQASRHDVCTQCEQGSCLPACNEVGQGSGQAG